MSICAAYRGSDSAFIHDEPIAALWSRFQSFRLRLGEVRTLQIEYALVRCVLAATMRQWNAPA